MTDNPSELMGSSAAPTERSEVEKMEVVEGGGFRLLTSDAIMKTVVRRCAALSLEVDALRAERGYWIASHRTLRRDVDHIKKNLSKALNKPRDEPPSSGEAKGREE